MNLVQEGLLFRHRRVKFAFNLLLSTAGTWFRIITFRLCGSATFACLKRSCQLGYFTRWVQFNLPAKFEGPFSFGCLCRTLHMGRLGNTDLVFLLESVMVRTAAVHGMVEEDHMVAPQRMAAHSVVCLCSHNSLSYDVPHLAFVPSHDLQ